MIPKANTIWLGNSAFFSIILLSNNVMRYTPHSNSKDLLGLNLVLNLLAEKHYIVIHIAMSPGINMLSLSRINIYQIPDLS